MHKYKQILNISYIYMRIFMYKYIRKYKYIYMRYFLYVYMHMCVCIYICILFMYIQAHVYIL